MTNERPPSQDFRALGVSKPDPLRRDRPADDEPFIPAVAQDGFSCFVHRRALLAMARWGGEALPNEAIGRLAGRLCVDGRGEYVLVERAIRNRSARNSPASVASDAAAQEALRRESERLYPALESVGWWHTHTPGTGLFYSPTDRQNQASWSDPNAIGILLSPALDGEGLRVFRGPGSEQLSVVPGNTESRILRWVKRRLEEGPHRPDRGSPLRKAPTALGSAATGPEWDVPGQKREYAVAATALCLSATAFVVAVLTHVLVWTAGWTAGQGLPSAPPARPVPSNPRPVGSPPFQDGRSSSVGGTDRRPDTSGTRERADKDGGRWRPAEPDIPWWLYPGR